MEQDLLEVTVKGLTFDPVTNVPIVVLKEVNGKLTSVMTDINRWRERASVHGDVDEEMQAAPAE